MHEIKPGVVFKDANVTVIAFAVLHGNLDAYGYRFAHTGSNNRNLRGYLAH